MSKTRSVISVVVFSALVLILLVGFFAIPGPTQVRLPEKDGGYDLTGYDLEDTVYTTSHSWESWPGHFYTASDLVNAEPSVSDENLDYTNVQFATFRMTLMLEGNATYGITLRSAEYAMRIFIDGKEIDCIGTPATSVEEVDPQVKQVTYYFSPQGGETQIIVQSSNFAYREGVNPPALTIGTMENIVRLTNISYMLSGLVFGIFMAVCLYHLALFVLNPRLYPSLAFSVLCLLLAGLCAQSFLSVLDSYNWYVVIKAEYFVTVSILTAMVVLVKTLFPKAIHTLVFRTYLALSSLYLLIVLFTDATFFSSILSIFQVIAVVMIVYVSVRLAMLLRKGSLKNILAVVGIVSLGMFALCDIFFNIDFPLFNSFATRGYVTIVGMVFFVFCYALIISIEQATVNKGLEESRVALAQAEDRYRALLCEKQDAQNSSSVDLADFDLTRRETGVALLLLNGKSRKEIAQVLNVSLGTVNTHCTNIYRKTECKSATELLSLILPSAKS